MAGQIDHMLAGAAAGLDRIAGFPDEESLEHGPDRLMVAVKCRRIEPPIGFGGPAILTEFNDIFSHARLPDCSATGLTRHGANRKALIKYRADYRNIRPFPLRRKTAPAPRFAACVVSQWRLCFDQLYLGPMIEGTAP
jgi:hypothetical protein